MNAPYLSGNKHHAAVIYDAARRGALYCTRDENQEPSFFVHRERDVPNPMRITRLDRSTIMLAVLKGLMEYDKYLPCNYHLGTGYLMLTERGRVAHEVAMADLQKKRRERDARNLPQRRVRERIERATATVPSYQCRMGCGQTLLTETARDIHEENCNGGGDE